MSRTLPAGLGVALAGAQLAPAFLVELDWPDGTVYVWNGYYILNWNAVAWQPTGHLGGIAEVRESSELGANGVQLSLSGIPNALVAEALANNSQGRPARIYFGVIGAGGFTIDPYLVFDGLIDFPNIVQNGDTSTITVNLEKEFIDNRSNARRWNHEDQQIDYPGDLGFQYVAALANKQFTWGKATPVTYPAGGNDGGDLNYLEN